MEFKKITKISYLRDYFSNVCCIVHKIHISAKLSFKTKSLTLLKLFDKR